MKFIKTHRVPSKSYPDFLREQDGRTDPDQQPEYAVPIPVPNTRSEPEARKTPPPSAFPKFRMHYRPIIDVRTLH